MELNSLDVLQVIEAVTERAVSWERTAAFLKGEKISGEIYVVEECSHAEEADKVAQIYRDIASTITEQLTKWQQEKHH